MKLLFNLLKTKRDQQSFENIPSDWSNNYPQKSVLISFGTKYVKFGLAKLR